ncbi:MAG: hypothetical protein AAF108_08955 [Planctomycetota bacterium]
MAKKKKTSKKKAAATSSKSSLSTLSTQQLHAELTKRQRALGTLERKRERLQQQLAEVDGEIQALGGAGGQSTRRRPHNEMSLVEALRDVLKGREMGVTETAEAVLKETSYQTAAANFRTIVNQTLLKSDSFKKVSRGIYTAA